MRQFIRSYGRSGMARRAIVVVASDGWERGDASLLGSEMRQLAELAHTVLWVHPHQGQPGFEPLTGGMLAALPHVDELLAAADLRTVARAIGRSGAPRRRHQRRLRPDR
jgi:uncharacterized protein with von Willebrand factor type A (vWA) domain